MAKYKAYPEYKDSGVEWLGKIPSGWLLKKAKYIFQRVQRPLRDIDGVVTVFRDGQVTLRTNRRTDGFTNSVKEIGYQGVRRNDLVIHAMDGFAGAIGVSDSDGKCSPVCSVCIPWHNQSLNMRFYGYLVRQLAVTDFILSLAKGIRERSTEFRFSEFSGLMLPIPSIYEQDQIAKFLDHETTKIDNLIERQKQLIELLKEKRQAMISHAVTKGLNPDVPMKDSGVEWLGEVPEHWDVSSLGYYSTLNTGATPDRSNPKYWNGDIAWIKTGEVNYDNISSSEEKITYEAVKNTSVRVSPPGTLLMAMYGQGITRGRVAILDISATYNQACVAISPSKTLYNSYLRLFFIAGYHAIRDGGNETSQMNLNADIVRKFKVLIPPVSEQKKIVSHLGCNLPQIDTLLERADSVIALLQERRTALISAAVTGKINVRDWIAPEASDIEISQEVTA